MSPSPPRVSGLFLSRVSALTKTILSSGIFLPWDFIVNSGSFHMFFVFFSSWTSAWFANCRTFCLYDPVHFNRPRTRHGTFSTWPLFYVNGVMVELTCFWLLSYTGRCKHAFVKTSCDLAGTNRTVFLYKIRWIVFNTVYIYDSCQTKIPAEIHSRN